MDNQEVGKRLVAMGVLAVIEELELKTGSIPSNTTMDFYNLLEDGTIKISAQIAERIGHHFEDTISQTGTNYLMSKNYCIYLEAEIKNMIEKEKNNLPAKYTSYTFRDVNEVVDIFRYAHKLERRLARINTWLLMLSYRNSANKLPLEDISINVFDEDKKPSTKGEKVVNLFDKK